MIVNTFNDLVSALQKGEKEISITRSILCNYSILLPEGVSLNGKPQENGELPLLSFQHSDGIGVSVNNSVRNLNIDAPSHHKAIFNTTVKQDLGTFIFENLLVKGQVSIITRVGVEKASVIINDVDIHSADARHYLEQPQKYGVNVLQGALTIYNINPNSDSLVSVAVNNLSIGRKNAPVSGSGVFISGFGDQGGKTLISKLHTKAVYSNGKIPLGVADYITAGVFVLYGTHATEVITDGEVITYGVNDMVLDVWGSVDNWTSNAPVISYGPSGVGFVNFGTVKNFTVNAPLQTYGLGARGYNQYDGTVENISFQSIETFGDGSVGIQISKKIGALTVNGNVTTHGSIGASLVKGVYVDLPAYALSIKDGGGATTITIKGDISTYGDNVTSYIVEQGGSPGVLTVEGKITASGKNSQIKKI
ncbi:hypothetical protein CLV59_108343 [Chitinophaga dinghuensis]|uniref:Uncharacterized protein n=1 Tax=Chitinophaga dinghuensis TaxID=1539050 RepID=A0A327VYJ2_9BACT|nr:hypothetical protein [Chitinophaga dinghuensis]RAJ76822.1 hypothetical protein CLV59_108343 [Chitinophaga dinghuensis]